jgi:hypothetical protein
MLQTRPQPLLHYNPRSGVSNFEDLTGTDICWHVMVHSAIVRCLGVYLQVMKLPLGLKLYRGLGGLMELPEIFYKQDMHGRCGYMEFAFLSTTAEQAVAMEYSGVKDGRPHAMVLEIEIDSVNRGACIADFSQYPGAFKQRVQLVPLMHTHALRMHSP